MSRLFFYVLFIKIAFSTVSSDNHLSEKECIASYLKDLKMLEASFEVPNFQNDCSEFVNKRKMEYKRDIMERLSPKDNQECVFKLIDEYKIQLLYMKGLTFFNYNMTSASDYFSETSESTTDLLNAVKAVCVAAQKYGNEYDNSMEARQKKKETAVNSHFQECMKKFFFENGILNAVEYGINVEQLNATDCEEIATELENSSGLEDIDQTTLIYGISSIKSQICVNQKIKDQKVLQKIASFAVVLLLDLNDSQILGLRSQYIDIMTRNVKFLLECLSEILFHA